MSSPDGPRAGGVLRIVGNGGQDGDIKTLADNLAYEIGFSNKQPLSDGSTFEIPQGVALMVDAGSLFKMRDSNIRVGSSAVSIDRSESTMQILGVPNLPVIFTSQDDELTGVDTNPRLTEPNRGDWGGLIFQNDVDRAEGRFDYEQAGIFLNSVSNADIRYGGGSVRRDSVEQVIAPIHMIDARPSIGYDFIQLSADAALSANPDSFEETRFTAVDSLGVDYQAIPFTFDYDRVGPDLRSNRLIENSMNGMFVRIDTPAGDQLERMTVTGRWDDTDMVHVVAENLVIEGRREK